MNTRHARHTTRRAIVATTLTFAAFATAGAATDVALYRADVIGVVPLGSETAVYAGSCAVEPAQFVGTCELPPFTFSSTRAGGSHE